MMTQSFLCVRTRVPSKKTYLEIPLDAYDVYVREAAINVDCVTVSDEEINWNVLIKFIVQYVKAWEN